MSESLCTFLTVNGTIRESEKMVDSLRLCSSITLRALRVGMNYFINIINLI